MARIELTSRRGRRIDKKMKCSQCLLPERPVWQYRESSVGEVTLCSRCRSHLWDKAFGEDRDILDFAERGGLVGRNRSKF